MSGDHLDTLRDELGALGERWENRISAKDFRVIGESYAKGRISLLLYFNVVGGGKTDGLAGLSSGDMGGDSDAYAVHLINKRYTVQCPQGEGGQDQVVFVDVVGLPDFPEAKFASSVRLYRVQQEILQAGDCFHYSTIRWRSFTRLGRVEGLLKKVPRVVGWETYSFRTASFGPHNAGRDVVQGCAEAVEGISKGEDEIGWRRLSLNEEVVSSLRVSLSDQGAEVLFGIPGEIKFNLTEVAVGPIDL